jgi:alkanesulfonate monooxygenase SsuD/methylene tetrahydromethanopterin reductase-like flavin-dependent oxidoreductase (luciferase family)
VPEVADEVVGGSSLRHYIVDMMRRDRLTIRQTYERVLPSIGSPLFKGTPAQIADQMEDWVADKACDGFTILSPLAPRGLRDFVDMVVPELQRRGAFRTGYQSTTLRGHLGLGIPINHHFQSLQ